MNQAFSRSPIEFLKHILGLAPIAGTGAAQNGVLIDTIGYEGAIGVLAYNVTGTPTGGSISGKFQSTSDSTGATGWADATPSVTVTALESANPSGILRVPLNLTTCNRYIRFVATSAPTGGSSTDIISAVVELAGADRLPAA